MIKLSHITNDKDMVIWPSKTHERLSRIICLTKSAFGNITEECDSYKTEKGLDLSNKTVSVPGKYWFIYHVFEII